MMSVHIDDPLFRLLLLSIFQRHDQKPVLDKYFIKRISLQLKYLCGLFMKKFWRAFANIPSNVRSPSTSSPQIWKKYQFSSNPLELAIFIDFPSEANAWEVQLWELRHMYLQTEWSWQNQYLSSMRALIKLVSWGKLLVVRLSLSGEFPKQCAHFSSSRQIQYI